MKIIYTYPMQISKGHTYMLSIIQFLNALAELNPIDLLCLDNEESISKYLNNNLGVELNSNLNIVQISNKKFGIKSNKFFFINNVLKYLKTIKHEKLIIYTRDFKQMRLCLKALKKPQKNIKFMFEVHQILSQNYQREKQFRNAIRMKKLEEYVFNNVDSLVCITSTLSSEIKRNFSKCTKKHLILPVGFDKNYLKMETNVSKKYDILYSGNFSKWKGLDFLLEAIAIIKNKKKMDISAILIGANFESKSYYEDIAKKNGISENINIMNRLEHKKIYQYMSESRVGVVPNTSEGDGKMYTSPLKLYEYLGAGMRVVVSKLPSIESNIDSSIVYFAEPENSEALASAIIQAINDESFKSEKVKKFAEDYTWDVRAQNLLNFVK
jgi:glycosyltransferase involved in cell wall biosynthesis